jgi:SAM-dependent methyltransferase
MIRMTSNTEQVRRKAQATCFGVAAGDYNRYRVGLPGEVVDRVLPAGIGAALDLGAGTGAMTRRLVERVERVYAVDPDPRMTELLAEGCPTVEVRRGTGEAIPLPDACVDAVVVASAWHWMDPAATIPEIARVLRPGGALCLVWNRRDRSVPWVADLEAYRLEVDGGDDWVGERVEYYLGGQWLPAEAPFANVEILSLPWTAVMTKDELVGMMTTFRGYISAPPERKPEILRKFVGYVDDHVAFDGDEGDAGDGPTVGVPMVCRGWRATLA